MRRSRLGTWIAAFVLGHALACLAVEPTAGREDTYPDPERFEAAIQAFEAKDREAPPAKGGIVCIGSSSMRGWHPTIREDIEPLTVIPRGFGGSNMNDALHYAHRIVTPYGPRAILLYEGDNDIAAGIRPGKVRDTFDAFVRAVHEKLPETRVYFLSIKPSLKRWKLWPEMQRANRLIAEACSASKLLTYVDVARPMLDAKGLPCKDIFVDDGLHMNSKGYALWRDTVRPILLERELLLETAAPTPTTGEKASGESRARDGRSRRSSR